jgi:hypothetical protein
MHCLGTQGILPALSLRLHNADWKSALPEGPLTRAG